MKRALVRVMALALILPAAFTTVLASGVELTGVGSRAQAMGGNYRAVAADWSAMYWNPAGLAFTKGLTAGASFQVVFPQATFTVANSLYGMRKNITYPFSCVYRNERPNESQAFFLPSAGVAYKVGNNIAFGLGVWAPFGLGSKWDLLRTVSSNYGRVPGRPFDTYSTKYPNVEYESNLQVIDIHPTVAVQLSDKLAVGAGLSFLLTDIYIRKPVYIQNPYLYHPVLAPILDNFAAVRGLSNLLAGMRQYPFDHLLTQAELDGNGTGLGANFGITFKATDKISIGASVQYYLDQNLEGTFSNTIYFPEVMPYQAALTQLADSVFTPMLQQGMLTPDQYFILTNYFSGQVVPQPVKDVKTALPLPAKFGIGVSYSGLKNMVLTADVAYTQWSAWDTIVIEDKNGGTAAELVQNWKNTLRFGVGMEYTAGTAKIRGGFYSEPPAAVDETLTVMIPDINRRNVFSLGLSVPVGPVSLAFNYEKLFIGDKTVTTWVYDKNSTAQNLAGTYTMNVNNLMVGIEYKF
ncbi:MAG: outer membrane protein transport protein [candidate division KSB1 bacterium]|nr:outer membrane protein transport protein [candidate division KSB1 bacterium]